MTLNRFFILFLLSSLLIYFGFNPFVIDQKKLKDIPQLVFDTFVSYEIEGESLNVMLVGENAKRYDDRLIVRDFALYRESNNSVEGISAMHGVYEGKEVVLSENVQYSGPDDISLQMEKAKLDMNHNTLDIRVPFVLTQDETTFSGSSLFFNQNNAKIKAKDIRASFNF
jgi:hypothetical protein